MDTNTANLQNKVIKLIFGLFFITHISVAQQKFKVSEVTDENYGIAVYDRFNDRLAGDSVRKVNGKLASSWISDFYESGKLLHKGYYIDGKLKMYKNYYENGKLEREYKQNDDVKSNMKTFYDNGNLKSDVYYEGENSRIWKDFYSNGLLSYWEEYDKNFQYYVLKKSMYENGNPKDILAITSNKKKFTKEIFYENGKIKEQGYLQFNSGTMDFEKTGKWLIYDEVGKLIASEDYVGGQMNDEVKY